MSKTAAKFASADEVRAFWQEVADNQSIDELLGSLLDEDRVQKLVNEMIQSRLDALEEELEEHSPEELLPDEVIDDLIEEAIEWQVERFENGHDEKPE